MTNRTTPNLSNIGQAAYAHRDTLRMLPGTLHAACDLARSMAEHLLVHSPEHDNRHPRYLNQRNLDAVLALIQCAADQLSTMGLDIVGEDDADLIDVAGGAE